MLHQRMCMRRIAFVSFLVVLPLTTLMCGSGQPELAGKATGAATASPGPAFVGGSEFSLEVSWEGSYTMPNGAITATYGPDTATIPLESKGNTYAGTLETVWHARATGVCSATGSPPVSFEVTAKKDASGDMDFTVDRTIVWT